MGDRCWVLQVSISSDWPDETIYLESELFTSLTSGFICPCFPCEHHLRSNWFYSAAVVLRKPSKTSGGKNESFPAAFTCKSAALLLCSHNGAQQIIVSSHRDGFHPQASWMWRETRLHSYVDLSALLHHGGRQTAQAFSICANVREKDRSQELTAAEVEKAGKGFSVRNRPTASPSETFIREAETGTLESWMLALHSKC